MKQYDIEVKAKYPTTDFEKNVHYWVRVIPIYTNTGVKIKEGNPHTQKYLNWAKRDVTIFTNNDGYLYTDPNSDIFEGDTYVSIKNDSQFWGELIDAVNQYNLNLKLTKKGKELGDLYDNL
jgi:hypothetical protein